MIETVVHEGHHITIEVRRQSANCTWTYQIDQGFQRGNTERHCESLDHARDEALAEAKAEIDGGRRRDGKAA